MNKSKNDININIFQSTRKLIKDNYKICIYAVLFFVIVIGIIQIYFIFNNKQILKQSIIYNDSINSESKNEFLSNMEYLAKQNSFYGLMATLELINNNIKNEYYFESYEQYINLLHTKNIDNLFKTLVSIHASYNLLNNIEADKIFNLLSYIDESLESFIGNHLEILYLLSLTQQDIEKTKSIYNQILNNEIISSTIKERVKKINEFEKYK